MAEGLQLGGEPAMTSQMERDLAQQFSDKLRRLICDTVDTFERVDMREEVAANLCLVLGKHLATIILSCGGNEDAFMTVVGRCFSIVKKQEREAAESERL